jgi:hypothetical protein
MMIQAWQDSSPETDGVHEEGGFVLRSLDGSLMVERWPRGVQNEILVPPHPDGKRGDSLIIATFHTHPNSGPEFQQSPGMTDIRAVLNDPHLGHDEYEGEYVIATRFVYRIRRNGDVELMGETSVLLAIT